MSVNVAQLQLGQLVNCGVDATHLLPNGGVEGGEDVTNGGRCRAACGRWQIVMRQLTC